MERLKSHATTDEVCAALERDGYAIVESLLERDHAARIRAELARLLEAIPTGRNDFEGFRTRRIYAIFAKTRAIDPLGLHPLVLGALDRVLGDYQFSAPVGIEIGPGEKAQSLHKDEGVYPIPQPHPEIVANVMWALEDFTEANGATRLVPRSHGGRLEPPVPPDTRTIPAEMPAGSAMLYLGSLVHGGGANRTDRPRLGVAIEYAASWLRPQETQLLAVPRDVVRTLAPRLQELLGYGIRPPFLGYVDGRHPRKILEDR